MPALLDDFKNNPTGSLVTIRCAPWYYKDKVALVGDAAHAVVPFYGQGMNAAFEDCVVLDECLAEFPDNRERAFAEYFSRRKENADALADLAVHNFIEMRDKTASKTFRAKKKLDHLLEGLLPGIYLPLYTMVTFTRIPYADSGQTCPFPRWHCLHWRRVSFVLIVIRRIFGNDPTHWAFGLDRSLNSQQSTYFAAAFVIPIAGSQRTC